MLDIHRILQHNHLTQVFTGLDQAECGQLFGEFVQAYKDHYPDSPRVATSSGSRHPNIFGSQYNQLFFILFCFRWNPTLALISDLFGLQPSQASEWINHLKPVFLRVYSPHWDNSISAGFEDQIQSAAAIVEMFPEAESVLTPQGVEAKSKPSALSTQQLSQPLAAETHASQVLSSPLMFFQKHKPLIWQAAAVTAAIAIPGLLIIFGVFGSSRAQVAANRETPSQIANTAPLSTTQLSPSSTSSAPLPSSEPSTANPLPPQPSSTAPAAAPAETLPDAANAASASGLSSFNHLYYAEDDPSRIVSVGKFIREGYEREEFLDYEAAEAFKTMKAAAAQQGVNLIAISGFREVARQQKLFDAQIAKLGSAAAAAKLSAPPGHSEHHTGYALDIGDANRPDADIKYAFEDTQAYRWLQVNAATFGFEESFPQNNQQGVSYEPWHWRYVASPRAASTFSVSKTLFP